MRTSPILRAEKVLNFSEIFPAFLSKVLSASPEHRSIVVFEHFFYFVYLFGIWAGNVWNFCPKNGTVFETAFFEYRRTIWAEVDIWKKALFLYLHLECKQKSENCADKNWHGFQNWILRVHVYRGPFWRKQTKSNFTNETIFFYQCWKSSVKILEIGANSERKVFRQLPEKCRHGCQKCFLHIEMIILNRRNFIKTFFQQFRT